MDCKGGHYENSVGMMSSGPMAKSINISRREAIKRRNLGVLMAAVAVAAAAALILTDVSRLWRWIVFVPFLAAALGFLQAHYST